MKSPPEPPSHSAFLPSRRKFCRTAAAATGFTLASPWWLPLNRLSAEVDPKTGRLLILHTNDIHDHVRPGFGDMGGLPYVSGYIQSVREQRDDVLLIDAGDVVEKGDLAAFLSHGTLTYEAMGKIGYDAITIGNHDQNLARDYPPEGWYYLDKLHEFYALSGNAYVALNLVNRSGYPIFRPSRTFEVNGVKVGVIGMVLPRPEGTLDFAESGRTLAKEAKRLKDSVHLIVVTCHVSVNDSRKWSAMAPDVDVFVSGHSHEIIHTPVVIEETGVIIVQAGSNALWVGNLELEVDLENGGVVNHQGELTFMCHDTIPADREMLTWIQEKEEKLYPGVGEVVFHLEKPVGWFGISRLAAEALRTKDSAEIGLCHPTHVIRNSLPPGPVDVNTLFRTSADRGHPLVRTQLTGAEIEAYLNGLATRDYRQWGQTQWAGFSVETRQTGDPMVVSYDTDLEPDRLYRVILPEREWEKRFVRLAEELRETGADNPLTRRKFTGETVEFSFIDALLPYVRHLKERTVGIHDKLDELQKAQGGEDPWEQELEPQFEARVEDKETLMEAGSPTRLR